MFALFPKKAVENYCRRWFKFKKNKNQLKQIINKLNNANIRTSLFINQ